jgi:hypothetical protein
MEDYSPGSETGRFLKALYYHKVTILSLLAQNMLFKEHDKPLTP